MTTEAAAGARSERNFRRALAVTSLLCLVVVLAPPLLGLARRYEFVQALQFSVLAVVSPVLLVLAGTLPRVSDRFATPAWSVVSLITYAAVATLWRTPWCVNALTRHGWLLLLEAATLMFVATWGWGSLVQSGQRFPTLRHPQRLAGAASVMWTIWAMAYLVGLSHSSWYRAYAHTGALSVSADQQLATALLWALSGAAPR